MEVPFARHFPVLLEECLAYLEVRPDGIYVDATTGLGGHTAAIAERLTTGWVLANDRDAESLAIAQANTEFLNTRIRFHQGPFSRLADALREYGVEQADGLLADLGVSRYQLTDAARGFSWMADAPLDMRVDRERGATAEELLDSISERDLADLLYRLGDERRSRRIARAIVRARPIRTTGQLARVVEQAVPRTGRLHPATQTFMALRIAVNSELEELDQLLEQAPDLVKAGGRVVIVAFMSLEDRKVKQHFLALARSGRADLLTRHVVRPTREEVLRNPPSRSAKLRVVAIR